MDATQTARRLLDARTSETPVPLTDWSGGPASTKDGYAVQAAGAQILSAEQGWTQIGWKIGGTNQIARQMLSIKQPFFGRLYGRCWDDSGFTFRATPLHLVWEPEIAIELGQDLDPADGPFDAARIQAATVSLRPALEIVSTCLSPWLEAGAPSLIADNGVHGHWVSGEPVTDWSGIDLMDAPVTLTVNGQTSQGAGRAVDGGCFGAAAWLANCLAEHGIALRAGHLVSTGTVLPPPQIAPGQDVVADFGALGTVRAATLP